MKEPQGEAIAITIKTERTNKVNKDSPPNSVREQAQKIEMMQKQKSLSIEKDQPEEQCYVRNSSFLSRDIEARKGSPPKTASPPSKVASPPKKVPSPPKKVPSPPKKEPSPPKKEQSPPKQEPMPPKRATPLKTVTSPPVSTFKMVRTDFKVEENSVALKASKIEASPAAKQATSPPVSAFKVNKIDSKTEENPPAVKNIKENPIGKEIPHKTDKLSLVVDNYVAVDTKNTNNPCFVEKANNDETNGVGDKIKKFERAAEDAVAGKSSRPSSARGRSRTDRLGSDSKDDFPPPATPFKDNVHFDLGPEKSEQAERPKNNTNVAIKWQRSESHEEKFQKPEPQKIIKPEFKPMPSPLDTTIRSPSLGTKVSDQFPSHGTAFRNVASPDQTRAHKFNDDVNTQNNFKTCKFKTKEKYSVSKGSSYFTRGSEEIWLVKKKDIEEIEERVLDSFRRAGGNICMRSESMRPSSDSGQSVSFSNATMGRNKRQMYARSESLDPQYAGARAQTLKRQTSVACTCGHDKKTRAKSATERVDTTPRPRSRSHGDDNQGHVLDKYETLV